MNKSSGYSFFDKAGTFLLYYTHLKKTFLICFCLLFICSAETDAQVRVIVKKILDELGNSARAYLLSANRPSYGVSSFTTPRNKVNVDIGGAFNSDFFEIPLSVSYGLTDKAEISTGISIYSQSYNFAGEKIKGIGDANIGFKYKFHESDYFEHSLQIVVKIPTASREKELGTGKADFHLGTAQGFYYKNFSYDFSAELNFLKRRDFPGLQKVPKLLQPAIDSIKKIYNYKYEQEMVLSFSPAYNMSENSAAYTGISFSRNFRLDYNSLQVFGGLGYSFSEHVSVSAGASYSLLNEKSWLISSGINLLL